MRLQAAAALLELLDYALLACPAQQLPSCTSCSAPASAHVGWVVGTGWAVVAAVVVAVAGMAKG